MKNLRVKLALLLLISHQMILVISVTLHCTVGKLSKKRMTESKNVSLNDATLMLNEDLKTLKKHIHIKRKHSDAYSERLTEEDLILQADLAESYRNNLQESTQSEYFGDLSFSTFIGCCYPKPADSGELQNDSVAVVTESSDHNRLVSMTCLQWSLIR